MKAMVFDDNPLIQSLLCKVLQRRGYEVTSFSDPTFCPIVAGETCPHPDGSPCADLIVTDLVMPKVHGLDFVERQLKKGCKCRRFALISGFWTEANLHRAKRIGLKTFTKPFRASEIYAWLDEAEKGQV